MLGFIKVTEAEPSKNDTFKYAPSKKSWFYGAVVAIMMLFLMWKLNPQSTQHNGLGSIILNIRKLI